MDFSNLFPQISSQLINGLVNMLIEDKVDNPYIKAVLGPLAGVFVNGILQDIGFDSMGKQAVGTTTPGSFNPETGAPLNTVTPQHYDKAAQYSRLYEESAQQLLSERRSLEDVGDCSAHIGFER